MHVLIVYGTNSSGTAVVAELVAAELTAAGHAVTLRHARDTTPPDLVQPNGCVLLASCTWERYTPEGQRLEGQLQQHMYELVTNATIPAGQRLAIIGLGDSSYTDFCAAADHLEAAAQRWQAHPVLPSLRIDAWFFDIKKNRERVRAWAQALGKKLT